VLCQGVLLGSSIPCTHHQGSWMHLMGMVAKPVVSPLTPVPLPRLSRTQPTPLSVVTTQRGPLQLVHAYKCALLTWATVQQELRYRANRWKYVAQMKRNKTRLGRGQLAAELCACAESAHTMPTRANISKMVRFRDKVTKEH